ncbi:MAG: hypothetical protein KY463_15285, partial [Actinobacteria bacterium]|nr:hypothetical protein [Actinomycetota bacterium]
MIVHIAFEVSDLERSTRFYDAVFYALGARRTFESERAVAYGHDHEQFWIVDRGRPPAPGYGHVALAAAGRAAVGAAAVASLLVGAGAVAPAWAHPSQHGTPDGHLTGAGAWGDLELIGQAPLTDVNDLVADVGVDPSGNYAYLANWGKANCSANSEAGGKTDPDAGVYVV